MNANQFSTVQAPDARKVGEYYDHPISAMMAKLWDGNLHYGLWRDDDDQSSFEEAMERMTAEMIRRLDPRPGTRILDVGCGNGSPAVRLARDHQVEVVGISISERQVARANERARAAGVADRVRFQHADAMDLPFEAGSFDGGWALESMLHMPDKAQVLSQVARVLRPGGRFPIADLVYRGPVDPVLKAQLDEKMSAPTEYAALTNLSDYAGVIESAGLTPLEVTDVSGEAHRSYQCFAEGIGSCRDEYVRLIGAQGFDQAIGNLEEMRREPALGYVLITACRP